MMKREEAFSPLICVVDFHHARGPEIERWFGSNIGSDPGIDNDWSLLPFLALPDGAHAVVEEFSYFTLRQSVAADGRPSSLFGISCTRQVPAAEVLNRSAEVTRSSIQKAVVVVVASPYHFARIREQLSTVTQAWFEQKDFEDVAILEVFQESLAHICQSQEDERDEYVGLSLREMIHEYKTQVLLLFKCCLLQPRMLFYGTHCEKMCLLQFSLISLIPGLLRALQDCSDPDLDLYEQSLSVPTSLRTSERASLLTYMGLPLQIFGKGSLFGPYTPLQQLDVLGDKGTRSYIAGSTNLLILAQKERYCDILINVDDNSITYPTASLKAKLNLSTSDRRWMDYLIQTVNNTWDSENPARPSTHAYTGSEEFLRLQFEEYILALLASVKHRLYVQKHHHNPRPMMGDTLGDPANDFGSQWVDAWMATDSFRLFNKFTDSHLFDIVEPRHPCAGGVSIEDFQRRVAQQVADLHLEERITSGKEIIGRGLTTGQKRVSYAITTLWADIEVLREAQRKKAEDPKVSTASVGLNAATVSENPTVVTNRLLNGPDLSQAQAQVQAASARAGSYLSSWGSWAAEKRKSSWTRNNDTNYGAAPGKAVVVPTPPDVTKKINSDKSDPYADYNDAIAPERNAWAEVDRDRSNS